LRRNNRPLSSLLQRTSAAPTSTHAGKEFAIFGTPPARLSAAMRPASTRI